MPKIRRVIQFPPDVQAAVDALKSASVEGQPPAGPPELEVEDTVAGEERVVD